MNDLACKAASGKISIYLIDFALVETRAEVELNAHSVRISHVARGTFTPWRAILQVTAAVMGHALAGLHTGTLLGYASERGWGNCE